MNRFLSLIIFVAIVVIGWTAAWFFAAEKIQDEARTFFAGSKNTQQQVNCEGLDVDGFPFRFDVTCTEFSISDLDLLIKIPEIKATILVYRPTHLLAFAQGPLTFDDSFSGSKREIQWDSFKASFRTNGWALARASIEAANVKLFDNLIGQVMIAGVQNAQMHLLTDEETAENETELMQLFALAKLENATAPEFDVANANLNFEATLNAMPDDLRQWTPAIIAKNWFETQTGVQVQKLTGEDDKSNFSIIGEFTTTAQAMLSGNFDFFSTDFALRFDTFLEPTAVQVLFGSKGEDGSHYQSYSLVHGVLLAGNLPILTFGPMR